MLRQDDATPFTRQVVQTRARLWGTCCRRRKEVRKLAARQGFAPIPDEPTASWGVTEDLTNQPRPNEVGSGERQGSCPLPMSASESGRDLKT